MTAERPWVGFSLFGMPPQKKPPKSPKAPSIKNHATTGKPTTPSGSGVVLGRTAPRNGSKKGTKVNMANPAKSKDWWEGAANRSHEQHDMVRLSAGLHNLADSLYRPGAEPDRPIRKSGGLQDQRLYEQRGSNRAAKNSTKLSNKTASKKSRTAAKMPNGRTRGGN